MYIQKSIHVFLFAASYLFSKYIYFQVAVIWILPVIFLHSRYLNKIKRKRKLVRQVDRLTPALAVTVMLLSAPHLANSVSTIALYPPAPLMLRVAALCLAAAASVKLFLYLALDAELARALLSSHTHTLVPAHFR